MIEQPAGRLILTPATDITVRYLRARGHDLVLIEFIDPHRGPSMLLLDAMLGRRLIGGLTTACDQADDRPQNLN
jgi:hypothetical protein